MNSYWDHLFGHGKNFEDLRWSRSSTSTSFKNNRLEKCNCHARKADWIRHKLSLGNIRHIELVGESWITGRRGWNMAHFLKIPYKFYEDEVATTDLNIKTGSSILWFLELSVWSQLLRLSFGFPIWLLKKLHWLDCLLTIAARCFRLELIIHNIPTIIKEKDTPQWNLDLLNWASQYGRQEPHFRTSDAISSLYFEISGCNTTNKSLFVTAKPTPRFNFSPRSHHTTGKH